MGGTIKRKDNPTLNGNTTNEKPKKSNSSPNNSIVNDKRSERDIRENIVLWKNPLTTLEYFIREIGVLSGTYGKKLLENKRNVIIFVISVLFLYILPNINGPQKNLVLATYKKLLWCLYWIGLGILSSVGLGTGLHTFLLYLGPHIARVTLAAYECGSLDFPEPPYPDDIICPSTRGAAAITIWAIMSKVRLECMCWGAGTALGELPPYFMAKAARLSGISDDDELREFEELQQKRKEDMTYIEWGKQFVEEIVRKIGFFGILACASVPNPLFDLAGITCGHFLVPFWTFFGATLIGKAIIKMHIQKLFVIIAFNETLINVALDWLRILPVIGGKLQVPFKSFLDGQKQKLHKNSNIPDSKNFIGTIFDLFVFGMILYFVLSIINSFAQSYHKRITKSKSSKD